MDKLKFYYLTLPEGFEEDYCIDAKKTSVGVALNLIALVIMAVVAFVCWTLKFGLTFPELVGEDEDTLPLLLAVFALCAGIIVYLVAHELVHGLFYKLFTKQRLRFGLTATVAYCGLKEGFVNKTCSFYSTLAPLVIHSVWMIFAIIFVPANVWVVCLIILFSLHVGGCVGDIYVAFILVFRYRKTPVLVSDDGPCQRFYTFKESSKTEDTPLDEKSNTTC